MTGRAGHLIIAALALIGSAYALWAFGRSRLPRRLRPVPAGFSSLAVDPDIDHIFPKLLLVLAPIGAFALLPFVTRLLAATYDSVVIGLLFTAAATAMVLPALCGELLLWSHGLKRAHPDEAFELELRAAGFDRSAVWVSETPIVAFWRRPLLTPALVVGEHIALWNEVLRLTPAERAGLAAAAPGARFAPLALWPLAAAALTKAADRSSVMPWWPFLAVAAVVVVSAAAETRRGRRTPLPPAGEPGIVRGALAYGLIQARIASARGHPSCEWGARAAWPYVLRKAEDLARSAGLPASVVPDAVRALQDREDAPSLGSG